MIYKKLSNQTEDMWKLYKEISCKDEASTIFETGNISGYTIIGLRPYAILKGHNDILQIENQLGKIEQIDGPLLDSLNDWISEQRVHSGEIPDLPEAYNGIMGYFSYDLVRGYEQLPSTSIDDLGLPSLYFCAYRLVIIKDKNDKDLHLFWHGDEGEAEVVFSQVRAALQNILAEPVQDINAGDINYQIDNVSFNEEAFVDAVEQAKTYIENGDSFQINLSVRQEQALKSDASSIYSILRQLNPSPYMGYINFPEFQIVSGSPEQLVEVTNNKVNTRPIAGTRSRGETRNEDARLEQELLGSHKERAEHIMLVDLLRNDLGRVSRFGSVIPNELMVVEKYSHVMHLVSNVCGELRDDCDTADVIRSVFPGGTITGAPKVRTMEIIEELEPVRRGIYTGSIGWIGFSGNMELNIAIRTMIVKDERAYVQAGAGIVADSNPEHEYKECMKKAAALWRAKELSEESLDRGRRAEYVVND